MSSPATIEDVARIAQVSIATVSRAIHTPEKVANSTRLKVNQAIANLRGTAPEGGTSLETAFAAAAALKPAPDNIVLLTDGLPTQGAVPPRERTVSGKERLRLFDRAIGLLPRDVMTYGTSHHSGERWASIRILESSEPVRVDGRQHADGRFAYTIDGPPGNYTLRVARTFSGQLCNPGTGACEDVSRQAGESLDVEFTRGRLFIGRVPS